MPGQKWNMTERWYYQGNRGTTVVYDDGNHVFVVSWR